MGVCFFAAAVRAPPPVLQTWLQVICKHQRRAMSVLPYVPGCDGLLKLEAVAGRNSLLGECL